jgi:flagellar protein FlgJ
MRIETTTAGIQPNSGNTQDHKKLADAAEQFEAMFLQEMLKPFMSSENSPDPGDKESDHSAETLSSFGVEAVAKAISKSGGLGIAKSVVQLVTHEKEKTSSKVSSGTKV